MISLGSIRMKAVVVKKFGPPEGLQVVEMDKPVPKDFSIRKHE